MSAVLKRNYEIPILPIEDRRPEALPGRREYELWLKSVTYRDACFDLMYRGNRDILLHFIMDRQPSPGTDVSMIVGDRFLVHSYHLIPLGLTRDEFDLRVFLAIVYAEEHEAAEQFLVDGDQPFHPHRVGSAFATHVAIPRQLEPHGRLSA